MACAQRQEVLGLAAAAAQQAAPAGGAAAATAAAVAAPGRVAPLCLPWARLAQPHAPVQMKLEGKLQKLQAVLERGRCKPPRVPWRLRSFV